MYLNMLSVSFPLEIDKVFKKSKQHTTVTHMPIPSFTSPKLPQIIS